MAMRTQGTVQDLVAFCTSLGFAQRIFKSDVHRASAGDLRLPSPLDLRLPGPLKTRSSLEKRKNEFYLETIAQIF